MNEVICLGSMFSRDESYEMAVERLPITGLKRQKRQHSCTFGRTQCSVGIDAVIR